MLNIQALDEAGRGNGSGCRQRCQRRAAYGELCGLELAGSGVNGELHMLCELYVLTCDLGVLTSATWARSTRAEWRWCVMVGEVRWVADAPSARS
jgi:hypothetical protein